MPVPYLAPLDGAAVQVKHNHPRGNVLPQLHILAQIQAVLLRRRGRAWGCLAAQGSQSGRLRAHKRNEGATCAGCQRGVPTSFS